MHGAELLLELGGVILGLGILGRVAGRLGLSPIPLYLLAGLAFGKGGLLPLVTAGQFIQTGDEIGVILLLLLLGIEYSAEELTGALRRSAAAGVVDLALNFTPGLAAGLLLGWPPLAAVVLGGVTYLPILTGLLAAGTLLAKAVPVVVALASVALVLAVTLRWGHTISRLVFTPNDEGLLLAPLRDLFAAVFFVFFGLQTDPAQLPGVALPALALAAVGVLTKLAAGWWAARRAGIGLAGRLRAGTVLVARGEFSIVIAGLAVAAGLQARLGPLATAYVLALAVLGPLVTRAADPLAAVLRRLSRPSGKPAAGPPVSAARTSADPPPANDGDKPVTTR